jgi:hypothetical protein
VKTSNLRINTSFHVIFIDLVQWCISELGSLWFSSATAPDSDYEGVFKRFRTESITKSTTIDIRRDATQRVMAPELTILTHKIASSGRELYHLQFSFQAASPETYGYTLV